MYCGDISAYVPSGENPGPELSHHRLVFHDPLSVVDSQTPVFGVGLLEVVLGGANSPLAAFARLVPDAHLA